MTMSRRACALCVRVRERIASDNLASMSVCRACLVALLCERAKLACL